MKKMIGLSISALSLAMFATAAPAQPYGPPPQAYQQGYQGNRWDAPPPDFNDVGRRAFHDGMDAAHNDWESHRPLNAQRSMMYRHPPTDRENRDQYRSSFMRGYQVAVEHRDHWAEHDHDHWGDHDHDNMPH